MTMTLHILDCTLRDGGYYNNWCFPRALTEEYLRAMAAAQIDIVEIGFRNFPQASFLGPHANDVCDSIRLHLDPAFRVEEGLATVERMGDGMFFETLRPRYTQAQVDEGAFSSIEEFLDHRQHRDVFIGAGTDPVAFAALQPSRLWD